MGNKWTLCEVALFKLDPYGNLVWSQFYTFGEHIWIGERVNMVRDVDGGFVISASVVIDASPGCGLLFKVNRAGEMLWYRIFPGRDWSHSYNAAGVSTITEGGYVQGLVTQSSSMTLVRYSTDSVASASPSAPMPREFILSSAYPNPFNSTTTISYLLPKSSKVKVEVFDVTGRRVQVLENKILQAGEHQTIFDGTGLATGIYFTRIRAGDFVKTQKMILLK